MKRYLIAFLIMLVGIALSWIFLRPAEWSRHAGRNREPIARVDKIFNEVNRQLEGRLMWEPVSVGELVFLGDKLKTSSVSSVTLTFLKQNSQLEIEENSMVKVEGLDEKVTLNMLEGRVFLKLDDQEKKSELDVVSGGKKLDVQGSVAVTVNQDGSSQVIDFAQKSSDVFRELAPEYGTELLQNGSQTQVSWSPKGEESTVYLEAGESASKLERQITPAKFSDGKMTLTLRPGLNYWRLVTKSKESEVSSPLMRLTLRRPVPPALLFPAREETLNLKDRKIEFRWSLGNIGKDFLFELGKDASLSEPLEKIEISGQTFLTINRQLAEGQYFWRVRSRQDASSEWLDDGVQNFKVTYTEALLSPGLMVPLDETISYVGANGTANVSFQWRPQADVKFYELSVTGPGFSKKLKLDSDTVQLSLPRSGVYTWSVVSQSKDGRDSISPMRWQFTLKERERVTWKSESKLHTYLDSFPIIILEWEKSSYRAFTLKISRKADLSEAETYQLSNRDFPFRPTENGFYYAQVQGLDDQGQVAGLSEVYEFKVEKAPLPPTPSLSEGSLLASTKGELAVVAKNYQPGWRIFSQLINNQGVIVDEREFPAGQFSLKGLLPGNYILQLVYLDPFNRKSAAASRTEVKVPEKSLISAPKLKEIKIR